MMELLGKDIETVIIIAFHLFKTQEERLMILSRDIESIKKKQIEL